MNVILLESGSTLLLEDLFDLLLVYHLIENRVFHHLRLLDRLGEPLVVLR